MIFKFLSLPYRYIGKDVTQLNLLLIWAVGVGCAFLTMLSISISMIDFEFVRNKTVIKDWHLRLFLFLIATLFTLWLIRRFIIYSAEFLNKSYLNRFHFLPETHSYLEANSKPHFTDKKYEHVVLLLHGFAASTQEFRFLIPELENNNINYFAPNILGFGSNNTKILNTTTCYDWYRDSLDYFDLLASTAKKVSIVGHSMGGILASYIAARRDVHKLILTAPGLYCFPADLKYKKILSKPFWSDIYIKLFPYIPKRILPGRTTVSDILDIEAAQNIFQYLAIPTNSLRELSRAQDDFDPSSLNCSKLSIYYGKHELTVDVEHLFNILKENNIKFDSFRFDNSGHNLLEDFERETISRMIAQALQE